MEGPSKICTELRSPRVNANLDPLLAIEDEDVLEGGAFGGSDNEEEDVARAERGNQLVNKETGYGAAEAMLAKQLLLVEAEKLALEREVGGEATSDLSVDAQVWYTNFVLSASLLALLGLGILIKKLRLLDIFIRISILICVMASFRAVCFLMKAKKIRIRAWRAMDNYRAAEDVCFCSALGHSHSYDGDDDTVDYISKAEEKAPPGKKKAEEEPSSEDETNDDNDDAILADVATVTWKLKEPRGLGELKIFVLMMVVSLFGVMMVVSLFGFMMAVSLLRHDDGGLVLFVLMMVVSRLEDNEKRTHDNENKISIMESEDLAVKVKMAILANTLQHQEQMIGYLRRRPSKLKID